jgi:hypothetical protein
MCDEQFFAKHSSREDETIPLSLETWVTNHSVTRRTIPEKQRAHPHRCESLKPGIFTCIQNSKKRLSLNKVALRETKLQDDVDNDDDDGDDDGNER